MTDPEMQVHARAAFETLCGALDGHGWKYTGNDETLTVDCGAQGDDLPMDITIRIDADRAIVMLISPLPVKIAEEKRIEFAVAVSAVNNRLINGGFDYDVKTGRLLFRMSNTLVGSDLGKEAFEYLLFCSCKTIDDYNDKFLMLAKGLLSIEKFMSEM